MSLNTSVIRPGLLVSLKTTVRGGVTYRKVDLQAETPIANGETIARWETERHIRDRAEHEAAVKVRGKARRTIESACCASSFGLLCPVGQENELAAAIDQARALADEFNATAKHTRVEVYALTGRVSSSDEEAARAISSEVRDLLDAMERGVKAADPDAIRDAANRARKVSGMLSVDVQDKVGAAIAEVRAAARTITARVQKAGETAATVVDELALSRLTAARFAVLDVMTEGDAPVAASVAAPAAPAIDLAPVAADAATQNDAPASSDVQPPAIEL